MSEFTVHTIPGSPFARAVFATLEEKGVPWRIAPLGPGMNRQEPHLSRQPFGRVPVLEHNGFQLYETQAILRYLDRTLPDPSLTPADSRVAARMDQVMNINDWYLFQGCANIIVFQRIIAPRMLGQPSDEAAITEAMPRARTVCPELSRLLGNHAYVAGDQVSLADFLIAPHLDFFAMTPDWAQLTVDTPNLVAWLARMEQRPSMQATTWAKV